MDVPYLPELLANRARAASGRPKRQRTRLALIAAAAEEIAEAGYEALTIDAIVRRAGLAHGTFYLYFRNRGDAAAAVRRAFNGVLRILRPRGMARLTPWEAIWRVNRLYVAYYARNARIAASHESLLFERREILASRDRINQRWAKILLRDLIRRKPEMAEAERRRMLLAMRYVIMLADEALRQSFTDPPPHLNELVRSEEEVTDVLTQLWYRCLYASDPHREGDTGSSVVDGGGPRSLRVSID